MPNVQRNKGNPASKRMQNETHKITRNRSWIRARGRKQQRINDQRERMRHNIELRAQGKPTAWEAAEAARWDARAPKRAEWEKRHRDL